MTLSSPPSALKILISTMVHCIFWLGHVLSIVNGHFFKPDCHRWYLVRWSFVLGNDHHQSYLMQGTRLGLPCLLSVQGTTWEPCHQGWHNCRHVLGHQCGQDGEQHGGVCHQLWLAPRPTLPRCWGSCWAWYWFNSIKSSGMANTAHFPIWTLLWWFRWSTTWCQIVAESLSFT